MVTGNVFAPQVAIVFSIQDEDMGHGCNARPLFPFEESPVTTIIMGEVKTICNLSDIYLGLFSYSVSAIVAAAGHSQPTAATVIM